MYLGEYIAGGEKMSLYDLVESFVGCAAYRTSNIIVVRVVAAVIAVVVIDFILSFFRRLMSY